MENKKVVILTGASSGIGYQTAQLLAKNGFKVYGAARRIEKMSPLKSLGVVPIYLDVTDDKSIKEMVDKVVKIEGHIDVLVNNAGFGYYGILENVPIEDARNQFEVNLFGLARVVQLVLPHMRKQGSGKIINISSMAGRMTNYMGGWYHASKYALESYSDALRMETKPFGIDVVIIEPGGIKTDWGIIAANHLSESSKGTDYEKMANDAAIKMKKTYTSSRLSDPSVISKAILKAITSRKPRTRYLVGYGAKLAIFVHGILPTRVFDKLVKKIG